MRRDKLADEQLLSQYRGMVIKLAWQYWKRLPEMVRVWVDPEDLIEEAYIHVLSRGRSLFDRRRGGQSTFLYIGISHLFLNFAIAQQAKKRFGWAVSVDELRVLGKRDSGLGRVESIDALLRCYQQASEECKGEMRRWFGFSKPKVHRSLYHQRIYQEFRQLAEHNRLSPNDCRVLMRSGMCLD
jgi:DNA-directed RNA polymerase specialized sigma24 family protein